MKHTPSEDLLVWEFDFALTTFFEVETSQIEKYIPKQLSPMEVSPGLGPVSYTHLTLPTKA